MNIPYVKKFNENGELINPITSVYASEFPNRFERRRKPTRFKGNKKGISLTIVKTEKYKRVIQLIQIIEKNEYNKPKPQTVENNHVTIKRINHYIQ